MAHTLYWRSLLGKFILSFTCYLVILGASPEDVDEPGAIDAATTAANDATTAATNDPTTVATTTVAITGRYLHHFLLVMLSGNCQAGPYFRRYKTAKAFILFLMHLI